MLPVQRLAVHRPELVVDEHPELVQLIEALLTLRGGLIARARRRQLKHLFPQSPLRHPAVVADMAGPDLTGMDRCRVSPFVDQDQAEDQRHRNVERHRHCKADRQPTRPLPVRRRRVKPFKDLLDQIVDLPGGLDGAGLDPGQFRQLVGPIPTPMSDCSILANVLSSFRTRTAARVTRSSMVLSLSATTR